PDYPCVNKIDLPAIHLRGTASEVASKAAFWRSEFNKYGNFASRPLWVTEHGYPSTPADQRDSAYKGTDTASGQAAQARYYTDVIPTMFSAIQGSGGQQGAVFVTIPDRPDLGLVSSQANEGMLLATAYTSQKPALAAFNALATGGGPTPTSTPVPPTPTKTPTPTNTPTRATDTPAATPTRTPAATPTSGAGLTRTEDADAAITYSGTWRTTSLSGASGGSVHAGMAASAKATFKWTGTSVDVIMTKGPTYGKVKITLDGASTTVDLYNASQLTQQTVYSKPSLQSKLHTLVIAPLGTKNAQSSSTVVQLDAIDAQ